MFDLKELPPEQRKLAEKMLGKSKELMMKELTGAISELQILESEMAADDFILRNPDDYTFYQYNFLDPLLHGMRRVFQEILDGEEKEEKEEVA